MNERVRKGLLVTLYSAGCGLMLSIFPFVKGGFNLIFSVLALIIGLLFFKRFFSLRSRIVFSVMAFVFFLLFTLVIAVITYANSGEVPAAAI